MKQCPPGHYVQIKDCWRLHSYVARKTNRFEFESVYCNGKEVKSETELLLAREAWYRFDVDKFTRSDVFAV